MLTVDKKMGMEEFVDYLIDLADKHPELFQQPVKSKEKGTRWEYDTIKLGEYLYTSYGRQVVSYK